MNFKLSSNQSGKGFKQNLESNKFCINQYIEISRVFIFLFLFTKKMIID